ncbi:efflux RND transporter permease subunit [Caulobacter segnis]
MFLPGYIGRLFVELAVAIASAVAFSALLALSLSPMMASKQLRPAHGESWLAKRVDAAMDLLKASYRASLESILGGWPAAIAGVLVVVLAGLRRPAVRRPAQGAGAPRGPRPGGRVDHRA